jgi:hypothetical protein
MRREETEDHVLPANLFDEPSHALLAFARMAAGFLTAAPERLRRRGPRRKDIKSRAFAPCVAMSSFEERGY